MDMVQVRAKNWGVRKSPFRDRLIYLGYFPTGGVVWIVRGSPVYCDLGPEQYVKDGGLCEIARALGPGTL